MSIYDDGQRLSYKQGEMEIKKVLSETDKEKRNELYSAYVDHVTPQRKPLPDIIRAFITGGLVCVIGQGLTDMYRYMGFDKDIAGLYETLTLILISVILTGFGLFSKIAKFSGAGVIVPITGFANSVASPAIEYQKEGKIFGIGCKIFTIAGPVILYGIFTSSVLGFIYWLLKVLIIR